MGGFLSVCRSGVAGLEEAVAWEFGGERRLRFARAIGRVRFSDGACAVEERSLSTYLPMMSHSKFTMSPPVCVQARLRRRCGESSKSKPFSETRATVRLTPSMAMEPFSTT